MSIALPVTQGPPAKRTRTIPINCFIPPVDTVEDFLRGQQKHQRALAQLAEVDEAPEIAAARKVLFHARQATQSHKPEERARIKEAKARLREEFDRAMEELDRDERVIEAEGKAVHYGQETDEAEALLATHTEARGSLVRLVSRHASNLENAQAEMLAKATPTNDCVRVGDQVYGLVVEQKKTLAKKDLVARYGKEEGTSIWDSRPLTIKMGVLLEGLGAAGVAE